MRTNLTKCALAMLALALAGCGAGTSLTALGGAPAVSQPLHRSWMKPNVNSSLLYVSDSTENNVYIYTFPAIGLVGTLNGFNGPHGLCTEGTDIWVTNTNASSILLYKHGAVLPSSTLADKDQHPIGCAWDRKGGHVAVSNASTVSGGPGSVSVFYSKKPTNYPVTTMTSVAYLSYDAKGNLFVDGTDASDHFQFAELPVGQTTFQPVSLNVSIGRPGGVQLNGKYLAVGDESTNTVYLVNRGKVVGSTVLAGASEVVQFFIQGHTLIGPDDGSASVGLWTFPGGGSPSQVITGSYLSKPTGAAVSTQ